MPKLSGLSIITNPVPGDYVVGVQTSGGPNDVRIPLNKLGQAVGVTTRRAEFFLQADAPVGGTGGATASNNEGPEILFTGTPTGFGRGRILIPRDYVANTTANLILMFRSDNANNEQLLYYVAARATSGVSFTSWNVSSSLTSTNGINLAANVTSEFLLETIPAAAIASGYVVNFAIQPKTAITGNIYLYAAVLEYSATV